MKEEINAFLEKIKVKLPEPRVMEGFGMELPLPYLERCLEIIVPASEKYFASCAGSVKEDFLRYVANYKTTGAVKEENVVPAVVINNKPGKNQPRFSRGDEMTKAVKDVYDANPDISQRTAARMLGIAQSTVRWHLEKIKEEEGIVIPVKKTGKYKGSELAVKDVADYLDSHPGATATEIARHFKVSVSTISRRIGKIKDGKQLRTDVKKEETGSSPAYKKGGYMEGLRARFEQKTSTGAAAVEEPGDGQPKRQLRLRNFALLNYFESLEPAVKRQALMEKWDEKEAGVAEVEALAKLFRDEGVLLRSRAMSVLEYKMLMFAFQDTGMSFTDKIGVYDSYLSKA